MRNLLFALLLCAACDSSDDAVDASSPDASDPHDASMTHDAGDEPDAAPLEDASADGSTEPACGDRDPPACEADHRCSTIGGREAGDDWSGSTRDDIPLGCHARGTLCGEAETCAYDGADGPAYNFRTTCLPRGWVEVEPTECEQASAAPPCETRALADCDEDEGCSIMTAQPVGDPAAGPEPVACTPAGRNCDDALTCAMNPDDERYVFPSTCLPAGWSELGYASCGGI